MSGLVVAVMVKPGETVAKGAPLMILEAMKMEHTIAAPGAGIVKAVNFAAGDRVKEGADLVDSTSLTRASPRAVRHEDPAADRPAIAPPNGTRRSPRRCRMRPSRRGPTRRASPDYALVWKPPAELFVRRGRRGRSSIWAPASMR
jgi:pyruvate/2-oxoglutarate dehydrogenase complex dihydrolipoamide acyltransferase (E2) component